MTDLTLAASDAHDILAHVNTDFDATDLIRLFNILSEGDFHDVELADDLANRFPCMFHYDERGNYVGPVANENGWTA